jgi:hypothetical protein
MSIQPRAIEWIATRPRPLVLGEGARLGTVGFLHAGRNAGYRIHLVHLDAPERILVQRRLQRGSNQSPVWMRGATTRASRIMERMAEDAERHYLSSDAPVEDLVREVISFDPRLEELCST